MSALKNIIRMSGRSSGVTFELRRKISKWANAWLALRYIGLGCFIIILSLIYLTKQVAYFKALGRDISIFSWSHFFLFIMDLFCFMPVLAHTKFPQNKHSLWHNDVGK